MKKIKKIDEFDQKYSNFTWTHCCNLYLMTTTIIYILSITGVPIRQGGEVENFISWKNVEMGYGIQTI